MASGEGGTEVIKPAWLVEQKSQLEQKSVTHAFKDSASHGGGITGQVETTSPNEKSKTGLSPVMQAAESKTLPASVQSGAGTPERLQGAQKKIKPATIDYLRQVNEAKS